MKRYNEDYHRCEMEESDDGEWVKFEDVHEYVACRVGSALTSFAINKAKKKSKESECNCDKASDNPRYSGNDLRFDDQNGSEAWICPAHGYKKL